MRNVSTLILAGTFLSVSWYTPANAQVRPDTRNMTCEQARQLVIDDGGVLLSTGPRTFDRYVSGVRYCEYNEILQRRWVQTTDDHTCLVGFSCKPRTHEDQ
ncbi:hypothetical protein PsAD2_00441 [Pseudovibrio axinellae]|uniref:Uncharacterized protein n=1 Tax=Pseudovibrio axinellae TaxID=989403 RepID=A0A166AID8_9HYPH|nr:hypothetical protein PsAD2_00441 [Pseudovibrio axinellae]SEQ89618.1 hypothetical protein SAMN05421798_10545 [Pseudovibrio axinellae]